MVCVWINPSNRMHEGVDLDLARSGSISGRTQYTYDDEKGLNQRQSVPKLSRDELEDRFYRVYEQSIEMKKRLNDVENKNRRLTTKLIRMSRNPCGIEMETDGVPDEQAQRLQQLELSESALRVKVKVLREQLAAHTRLHSAALHRRHVQSARAQVSRQSRSQTRESDGTGTRSAYTLESVRSRSHGHPRTQSQDSNHLSEENSELKKQINSLRETIGELQKDFAGERKRYQEQVSQLEAELSEHLSADTADNVQLIRLRRSIRQHEVALTSLQQEFAGAQRDLLASRNALAQAARDHEELSESLVRERQKCSSLQQEILLLSQECSSARDLSDQIADVKRENDILKKHNNQLLLLTTEKGDAGTAYNGDFRQLTSSTLQQLREECTASQKEVADARAERLAAQRQLEVARQECSELRKRADEERVNAETWREAHQRLQMQLDDVNFQLIAATKRLDDLTNQLFSGQDMDKRCVEERSCHQATQTDLESQSNHNYQNPATEHSSPAHLKRQTSVNNGLHLPDACLSLLEQTTVGTGPTGSNLGLLGTSLQDRFFKLCSSSGTTVFRPQSVSDMSTQEQDAPALGTPIPAPRRTRSHEQMTLSVGQLDAVWELEKYRELLRVQCNLNNMYKKEVTSLNQIVRSLASGSS